MKTVETQQHTLSGRIHDGHVILNEPVPWPDGTAIAVRTINDAPPSIDRSGRVIVAGFGLAGRCVAELLRESAIMTVIVEQNVDTVDTQRSLGMNIVRGDITDIDTLIRCGVKEASALALTIPDEDAVLRATSLARELNPGIFIIARTNYASKGMQASHLGADEVIKAEHAVALQFRERIRARFNLT